MKKLLRFIFELLGWLVALIALASVLALSGFWLGCFYACARLGWNFALRLLTF